MHVTLREFHELVEVAVLGQTIVEALRKDGGRVRIYAVDSTYGSVGGYVAHYDELLHVVAEVDGQARRVPVWSPVEAAEAAGGTVDDCLRRALLVVNNWDAVKASLGN
jgi:hypothetical protein